MLLGFIICKLSKFCFTIGIETGDAKGYDDEVIISEVMSFQRSQ